MAIVLRIVCGVLLVPVSLFLLAFLLFECSANFSAGFTFSRPVALGIDIFEIYLTSLFTVLLGMTAFNRWGRLPWWQTAPAILLLSVVPMIIVPLLYWLTS